MFANKFEFVIILMLLGWKNNREAWFGNFRLSLSAHLTKYAVADDVGLVIRKMKLHKMENTC